MNNISEQVKRLEMQIGVDETTIANAKEDIKECKKKIKQLEKIMNELDEIFKEEIIEEQMEEEFHNDCF